MKQESKYYTPSIGEFRVGFRYEMLDGNQWVKRIFKVSTIHSIHVINAILNVSILTEKNVIRAKHLDRADIEECGWEYEADNDYTIDKYYLTQDEIDGEPYISIHNGGFMDDYHSWFEGYIRNINELQDVMRMVGIKSE